MGFSASAPTGFQGHHLIPDGLKGHRVLDALGSFFNIDDESLNRINLPDSGHAQSARASGLALSDSVPHSGRHTAYTNFVTELLDGIGGEFLEEDGSLKSSKTVADLDREVKRLQYFLADGLTPSLAPGGHSVRDPWIFLNNADPRLGRYYSSTELLTKMQQHVPNYDALRANEGNLFEAFARGDELIDKIDFQSLSEPLDGEKGNSGLSALIKKAEGYKALGIDTMNGVDISDIKRLIADLTEGHKTGLAALKRSGDFPRIRDLFAALYKDSSGSTLGEPISGAMLHLVDKLGPVQAVAIGLAGISLYQIASKYDIDVAELIAEFHLDISPEMIEDLATGIVKMAFETAVVTMATGGVGTVLRLAYLVQAGSDTVDLIKLSLELYRIAFPGGALADIIESVLPDKLGAGESFAKSHIESEKLLEHIGIDFAQFNRARSVVVIDDIDAAADTRVLRKSVALGSNPGIVLGKDKDGHSIISDGTDIMWGRNGATVDGRGGSDLLFHTGYGTALGGDGNDVVIGQDGKFIAAGQYIDDNMHENFVHIMQRRTELAAENVLLRAQGLPEKELPAEVPDSPKAFEDMYLTLDGGAGNDMVVAMHDGSLELR